MFAPIHPSWQAELAETLNSQQFISLQNKIADLYDSATVYPPRQQIFAAFNACEFDNVKVVIVGQDPYHGKGQANGLAFSVAKGIRKPPSLVNIFKEIEHETGAAIPLDGDLTRWAQQGVLLLNTILTVEEGRPESHKNMGWEELTDLAIRRVSDRLNHVVFMLWGRHAASKARLIDANRHLVLTSAHPSPLSFYRGFFGNGHFSGANEYLIAHHKTPVQW